jgi:hypothetical protein
LRPALRKQFAKNGTVTPFLVLAVAAEREVRVAGESREQIENSRRIRFFHFGAKSSLEGLPRFLVV